MSHDRQQSSHEITNNKLSYFRDFTNNQIEDLIIINQNNLCLINEVKKFTKEDYFNAYSNIQKAYYSKKDANQIENEKSNPNKILTPNNFLLFEFDEYYQFIKSNSDLNSDFWKETNNLTNTLLGIEDLPERKESNIILSKKSKHKLPQVDKQNIINDHNHYQNKYSNDYINNSSNNIAIHLEGKQKFGWKAKNDNNYLHELTNNDIHKNNVSNNKSINNENSTDPNRSLTLTYRISNFNNNIEYSSLGNLHHFNNSRASIYSEGESIITKKIEDLNLKLQYKRHKFKKQLKPNFNIPTYNSDNLAKNILHRNYKQYSITNSKSEPKEIFCLKGSEKLKNLFKKKKGCKSKRRKTCKVKNLLMNNRENNYYCQININNSDYIINNLYNTQNPYNYYNIKNSKSIIDRIKARDRSYFENNKIFNQDCQDPDKAQTDIRRIECYKIALF